MENFLSERCNVEWYQCHDRVDSYFYRCRQERADARHALEQLRPSGPLAAIRSPARFRLRATRPNHGHPRLNDQDCLIPCDLLEFGGQDVDLGLGRYGGCNHGRGSLEKAVFP